MSWIVKFLLSIMAILVIGVLLLIFVPRDFDWSKSLITLKKPLGQSSLMPMEVLTIDAEGAKPEEALERLRSGDSEILLAVITQSNGATNTFLFDSARALARLSINNSGYLDSTNPEFKNLTVARLNEEGKVLYYTPVQQAGIAAISIDPNYLSQEILSDPRRYDKPAGKVIYSDSSQRLLRVVLVPNKDLQNLQVKRAVQ